MYLIDTQVISGTTRNTASGLGRAALHMFTRESAQHPSLSLILSAASGPKLCYGVQHIVHTELDNAPVT